MVSNSILFKPTGQTPVHVNIKNIVAYICSLMAMKTEASFVVPLLTLYTPTPRNGQIHSSNSSNNRNLKQLFLCLYYQLLLTYG